MTTRDCHGMSRRHKGRKTSPAHSRVYAGSYTFTRTNLGYVTWVSDPCHTNQPLLMNFARELGNSTLASENRSTTQAEGI